MALKKIGNKEMRYATSTSKHKRKMAIYECSGCGKKDWRVVAVINAGYTNWCVPCGLKARTKRHQKEWL